VRSVRLSEVVPPYFLSRARAPEKWTEGKLPHLTSPTSPAGAPSCRWRTSPTSYLHQRGQGWPASERVVALLLPFDADEAGLAAGRSPRRDPRDRRSWEARAGELDHEHDQQHPSPTGEPTQRAMTESVISRTYETLSVNSPDALQVCARVGESAVPRRSSRVQAIAVRTNCWWTPKTSFGAPFTSGKCTGLALSTATKFKFGRSGGHRCPA
jgi:hypothetical protein